MVTVVAAYTTTGAEIRPVAGAPKPEQARSSTRCGVRSWPRSGDRMPDRAPSSRGRTRVTGSRRGRTGRCSSVAILRPRPATSTDTQPGGPRASVRARKIAPVSSWPARRHDHPDAPGKACANSMNAARRASNAEPVALSAPVVASNPDSGKVRSPQVRRASGVPAVAAGEFSGGTGHVGAGDGAQGGGTTDGELDGAVTGAPVEAQPVRSQARASAAAARALPRTASAAAGRRLYTAMTREHVRAGRSTCWRRRNSRRRR